MNAKILAPVLPFTSAPAVFDPRTTLPTGHKAMFDPRTTLPTGHAPRAFDPRATLPPGTPAVMSW